MAKQQPTVITVEKKLLALGAKLSSAPIGPAQRTVLKFAPAVAEAPSFVIADEQQISRMLEALPDMDPMLLARAFMAQESNSQGLTPQQLYVASPVFWSTAGAAAGQIAMVKCPDGVYRASGLISVVARAASGFTDHLYQVVGKNVDGVQLIKPISKSPALPKATFQQAGHNGEFLTALLEGIADPEHDMPSIVVRAGKSTAAAVESDPFADLDGWL